jgi:hypothetical protein
LHITMNEIITPRQEIYPVFENRNTKVPVAVVKEFQATFQGDNAKQEKVTVLVEPNGYVRIVPRAEQPVDELAHLPTVL